MNPSDADGNPMRCRSCDSVHYLGKDCPHSYENLKKVFWAIWATGHDSEEVALFTGALRQDTYVCIYRYILMIIYVGQMTLCI